MLMKITNNCKMECSHCGEDSNKYGKHMDERTLYKSLSFIKKCNTKLLSITGGEPLEHPQFFRYCEIIKRKLPNTRFLLLSNGMFLKNEKVKKMVLENDMFKFIQIINDPKYYPIKIKNPHHSKIRYFNKMNSDNLINIGRAKNLNVKKELKPQCFNTRQCFNKNYHEHRTEQYNYIILQNFIKDLETKLLKFCAPSIDINGMIHPSEWSSCGSVGTVFEPMSQIIANFKNFKCNKCKLFNNLPFFARQQLDE